MDVLTLVVASVALAIIIHLSMRHVMVVLGRSPLRNGFDAGPDALNPELVPTLDADLFNEMLELGFKPLGIYWEQVSFSKRHQEYIFVRPGENCYGNLYRSDSILPRRGSFFTVFPDGAVVFSKNYAGGVELRTDDFIAEGAGQFESGRPKPASEFEAPVEEIDFDVRIPLATVLERHRENVNRFIFQGHKPPSSFDADAFCVAQHLFYQHPALRQQHRSAERTNLIRNLLGYAFVPAILMLICGVTHPLPWLALLIEAGWGLVRRYRGHATKKERPQASAEEGNPSA
jgi:hypothetical protein